MVAYKRNIWNRFPLFKLLIPFIAGIIAGIHELIPIDAHVSAIISLILLFFLLGSTSLNQYSLRWVFGTFAMSLLFFVGYTLVNIQDKAISDSPLLQYDQKHNWLVETRSIPEEKENSYMVVVEVLGTDSFTIDPEKTNLYIEKDSSLIKKIDYGNRLIVHAHWQRPSLPTNPEQFNYRQYLERNGITHHAYVQADYLEVIHGYENADLRGFIFRLRENLLQNLKAHGFSGDEFSLASAILLGKDNTMDPRLRSGFSTAGAMHILCVSGLHVGVIFLILDQLLRFLNKRKKGPWIKAVVLILMIWFYAALTGLEPSVLRASTMVSFVIIGRAIKRPTSVYNSLSASAFLLLIINPLIITQIGFQLSYLAVLAIVSFQPLLYKLWLPRNKILDNIWGITTVSIAAQMGTFPLAIYYFHIFPVYFLITNLIVIPLSSFIIYTGFLFFITVPVQPLAFVFGKVLYGLLWFLKKSVFVIEALPSASLNFLGLNPEQVIVIYLIFILLFVWFSMANRRALITAFGFAFILSLMAFDKSTQNIIQQELVFYDAGRGLAIEAVNSNEHVVLIDTTIKKDKQFAAYNMQEYWVSKGLKKPEIFVINEISHLKRDYLRFDKGALVWNDKLFYILDKADKALEYPVNYLVVHHHKALPKQVHSDPFPQNILLTGKVPPWNIQKWKTFGKEQNISVHELNQNAFVMNTNQENR